jgi:hypothetical protein
MHVEQLVFFWGGILSCDSGTFGPVQTRFFFISCETRLHGLDMAEGRPAVLAAPSQGGTPGDLVPLRHHQRDRRATGDWRCCCAPRRAGKVHRARGAVTSESAIVGVVAKSSEQVGHGPVYTGSPIPS